MRSHSLLAAATALAAGLTAQPYDYAAAARYSEQRTGHALLVAIDGKIAFERYANGYTGTAPHRLASGTKSFNGVLAAMAVEDGLLRYDERVADTITEWRTDPRKSKITYRQLLSLQSGLWGGTNGMQISYAQSIHQRTIADPGVQFSYGPIPYQVFGEAMTRKLAPRESVAGYYKRRMLDPLGMTVPWWTDWNIGEPRLPGGARTTAREWLKFGELVRLGGVFNGRRLVAQRLLDECFARSPVRATYGLTWWLPNPGSTEPDDAVFAKGAGKQRLIVIRSHRMVIVRFGETTGTWSDPAFLRALMPAAFARFGQGCRGSNGVPSLDLLPGTGPWIGESFGVRITGLPLRTTSGATFVGASNRWFGSTPLPLDLGRIGMPGCSMLVSPDLPVPFVTGSGGVQQSLRIPRDPRLVSFSIYLQTSALDPPANALGVTLSNGGAARIGAR